MTRLLLLFLVLAPALRGGTAHFVGLVTVDPADIAATALSVDEAGNLYMVSPEEIKRWNSATGELTTTGAGRFHARAIAADGRGNVFVLEDGDIKQWTPSTGQVTTLLSFRELYVTTIVSDGAGDLYFIQLDKPVQDGVVTTANVNRWSATTGQVTTLLRGFQLFDAIGVDRAGTLYVSSHQMLYRAGIAEQTLTPLFTSSGTVIHVGTFIVDASGNVILPLSPDIKMWNPTTRELTTVASGFEQIDALAGSVRGDLYVSQRLKGSGQYLVQRWSAADQKITTLFSSDNIFGPWLTADRAGNLYFSSWSSHPGPALTKWDVTTHAKQTLVSSELQAPYGVAVDGAGDIYIADTGAIKKLNVSMGLLVTLVSSGLTQPTAIAVAGDGTLYIIDTSDEEKPVLKQWSHGSLTTLNLGLSSPADVKVDGAGNLYVTDFAGAVVKWTPATQQVTRLDIRGLSHPFAPSYFAVDDAGTLYISDPFAGTVIQWDPLTQKATEWPLTTNGLAVDGAGNLYTRGNRQLFRVVFERPRARAVR